MIEFHSSTGSVLDTAAVESSVPHTAAAMTISVLMMIDSSWESVFCQRVIGNYAPFLPRAQNSHQSSASPTKTRPKGQTRHLWCWRVSHPPSGGWLGGIACRGSGYAKALSLVTEQSKVRDGPAHRSSRTDTWRRCEGA